MRLFMYYKHRYPFSSTMTTATKQPVFLFTTREVAEQIAEAKILPNAAKPLSQRSIARLCKRGRLPGAYLVQGDWCIPQEAVTAFIDQTRGDTHGRPPRKKKGE